jgi:hypothetical protein
MRRAGSGCGGATSGLRVAGLVAPGGGGGGGAGGMSADAPAADPAKLSALLSSSSCFRSSRPTSPSIRARSSWSRAPLGRADSFAEACLSALPGASRLAFGLGGGVFFTTCGGAVRWRITMPSGVTSRMSASAVRSMP